MKRKRITKSIVTATPVSLSHLKAFRFQPVKRTYLEAKSRYERLLRREITLMFKDLSYSSILNEKRDLRYSSLNVRNGRDTVCQMNNEVFVPTSQVWMKDPVLGIVKKGCNFVKRNITKLEVYPTIQWVD